MAHPFCFSSIYKTQLLSSNPTFSLPYSRLLLCVHIYLIYLLVGKGVPRFTPPIKDYNRSFTTASCICLPSIISFLLLQYISFPFLCINLLHDVCLLLLQSHSCVLYMLALFLCYLHSWRSTLGLFFQNL